MTGSRLAGLLVRAATCLLPRGAVRRRYRQELLGELDALPADQQLGYAWSLLAHAWPLRRAVTSVSLPDPVPFGSRRTAPLHCLLHLYHHDATALTDDGERYRRCVDCGRDYGGSTSDYAAQAAMIAPSGYWY